MAGIYLHIPFCKQACHYCNFHFSTSTKLQNEFSAALLKEIALRQAYLDAEPVETIYFGGGTPSLLPAKDLDLILQTLHRQFSVMPGAEITLEANPDDINTATLKQWQQLGINRLSMGVQSFFEADLQWMNRAHNHEQAIRSIKEAQDGGFHNISIDLIYGTPTLPDAHWQQNVEQAVALQIPHLSCYALTVEPKTALEKMIEKNKKEPVSTDDQARQFMLLMQWLETAGYEHYEISNFALPGHRSRHNSSYWQGKPYLGLGPSAHSYNRQSRQWNIANNALYIKALEKGEYLFETETLSNRDQLNEYIMIALRTTEGIDLEYIDQHFSPAYAQVILQEAARFMEAGSLIYSHPHLCLTRAGRLLADGIAADLFFEKI